MTNKEFAEIALNIAQHYPTIYLWGTFGAPLTEQLIRQKAKQYPNNYSTARQALLRNQIPSRPWAFDCVGLIKGILWGWNGTEGKSFGGAVYQSNGVPDINAGTMAKKTLEQSADFAQILPGEAVFKNGHIGIYVGDGRVVEATLNSTRDGVVLTALTEGGWTGHGKLPWLEYAEETVQKDPPEPPKEEAPPQVGDRVYFSGNRHYTSSSGNKGSSARPGPAKVTHRAEGRKHPYHIIHTDKTSNVYGWVDKETIRKI